MTAACPACVSAPHPGEEDAAQGVKFSMPTIHCAACIQKIERGLQTVNGVTGVRVNLSLKRLTVTGPVSAEAVMQALISLGFEAYPLDLEALQNSRDDYGRGLLIRLSVAGFAMMNVMLLSVAVWSGATDATRDLFHLISAMITVPVVAYAGQPFFDTAAKALRVGRLNMDVPISLAILLAAGMSLYETLNSGAHAYFDAALSLTFFLLIGRYMDHRTRTAAHSAAKELTALEVHSAQRVQAGQVQTVNVAQLQIGDIIAVSSGSRVPVDGFLLSGDALIDRSILSGESAAVTAREGDMLQAGEINLSAPIQIQATAVGEDCSLRRMAALVETAENARNSYTALADKAAQAYAPAVHLLAFAAFVGWYVATGDMRHSLNIAVAVLIITCPCALGLAVPAVSTAAISRLFSRGFLVKHATALERLAEVDHAVFDKTGTLTQPMIEIPQGLDDVDQGILKGLAQRSSHPMSRAVVQALTNVQAADLEQLDEQAGDGLTARFAGAEVKLGRGAWLKAGFAGLGLQTRVGECVELEKTDVIRPGVQAALAGLHLPCEVVTGDAEEPAQRLRDALNLPVTARATPSEKLKILEAHRAKGHHVLMVGDGLNDTAALAAAHASIAPATALDASRNAADIVVLKDSFEELPLVLAVARATRRLSEQNFAIAGVYNLIAVPIALAGYATPLAAALAMSVSSITVLLNAQRMRSVS